MYLPGPFAGRIVHWSPGSFGVRKAKSLLYLLPVGAPKALSVKLPSGLRSKYHYNISGEWDTVCKNEEETQTSRASLFASRTVTGFGFSERSSRMLRLTGLDGFLPLKMS